MIRSEILFKLKDNQISSKCIKAHQLTEYIGIKYCLCGVGYERVIKSRQTLNIRYDLKIVKFKIIKIMDT